MTEFLRRSASSANNALVVATAGWSIPRALADQFAAQGTHLARYSRVMRGVEINSSFYRDHASSTYARWAAETPRAFSFAVKLPRSITHEGLLRAARKPLKAFLSEVIALKRKQGPLLAQLPPSLQFERRVAQTFFGLLRTLYDGPAVCEPRHASWFTHRADHVLQTYRIGRVAADPAVVPAAALPGGSQEIIYYRLHGTPDKYWSAYGPSRVAEWARALRGLPRGRTAWCVFDNTAAGHALADALLMRAELMNRAVAAVDEHTK